MVRRGVYLVCAVVATAIAVGLQAAPAAPAGFGSRLTLTSYELGVLTQLNEIRVENGLPPLRLNAALTTAASRHCAEMAADGYFGHDSAGGVPLLSRIRHYYSSTGYGYWSAGENLLWSSGSVAAARALDIWMASDEHRANLLSPLWRDIGIAAISAPDAPGVYDHLAVTVIATDFGVRK